MKPECIISKIFFGLVFAEFERVFGWVFDNVFGMFLDVSIYSVAVFAGQGIDLTYFIMLKGLFGKETFSVEIPDF